MAGDEVAANETDPSVSRLASSVQAHLGKASRFADGNARDWTFFFFFRIVPKTETGADLRRLADVLKAQTDEEVATALRRFVGALNAGLVEQGKAADERASGASSLFTDWLSVLTVASSA